MKNLKSLIVGNHYTIAGFTLTGKPYAKSFRLVSVTDMSAGNHLDSFVLKVKLGLCRHSLIRLTDADRFVIWEGKIRLIMKEVPGWYVMDPRYLQVCKSGIKKPVIEN